MSDLVSTDTLTLTVCHDCHIKSKNLWYKVCDQPCQKVWQVISSNMSSWLRFIWIILTSLLSMCMQYRDRQKPTNRPECRTPTTKLGIFYIHYHIDKITNGTAFDEPVGGTGQSKSVTHRQQVNCQHGQSERNRTDTNHQPSNHWQLLIHTLALPHFPVFSLVRIWPLMKENSLKRVFQLSFSPYTTLTYLKIVNN